MNSVDLNLLKYYAKLREHRCGIAEGIRVIAFRNMDHLSRTILQLGITDLSEEASRNSILNKMLEDQGLHSNHMNRWLLQAATWVPWEIYMCLLDAEIDNYKRISDKHPSLTYEPLEDYFLSHPSVVTSRRKARHSLLHPLKETTYEENLHQFMNNARKSSADPKIYLVRLQNLIDEYLEWFQETLRTSLADEISRQSYKEVFEFKRRHIQRVTDIIDKTTDADTKAAITSWLDGFLESSESLPLSVEPDYELTTAQRRTLSQWEEAVDILGQALPERPYSSSQGSVQTPIHKELSSFLSSPARKDQPAWTGQVLPEYLQGKRSGYIGLLFRSFIILNEMGIYLTQVTTRCRIGEMEDYPRNLAEFEARFATEQACREYLCQLRWPEGFRCPRCGHDKAWAVRTALLECAGCGHQASPTAGTIFQDTRQPLQSWFRAMWWLTSQKNGASALGLQRVLGLGSYKTAWTWLHKLRRAMVRPGRDRLSGRVEVDETYLGGLEEGVRGRQTDAKALIVVAAEEDGAGIGRVRIRTIPNASGDSLMAFVGESIEPGSVVHTDGWLGYEPLEGDGYRHEVSYLEGQPARASKLLPRVHRVVSLVKRWILGTHQGAVSHEHLDSYLDEFAFRFNRRKSRSRGKLFYRLVQQAVAVPPAPYKSRSEAPRHALRTTTTCRGYFPIPESSKYPSSMNPTRQSLMTSIPGSLVCPVRRSSVEMI